MPYVFGYVRASTKEEVKQGSMDRQKNTIKAWADQKGYEVIFYEDSAYTGKKIKRPGLERMFMEIDTYKPVAVIVTKIDRFARSLKDLQNMISDLQGKGVDFIAIEQPDINTSSSMGKLLLQLLGAFAEFEVNLINERTKAGREYAMMRGVKFGRPELRCKDGYIDKKKVIELYNMGFSIRGIAKAMKVSRTPIRRIVQSIHYDNYNKNK